MLVNPGRLVLVFVWLVSARPDIYSTMRSLKDRSASGSIDTRYVPEAGRSRTRAAAPSQCHAIVGSVTESAVPITVASPAERVFLT